ncbi:MAG: peptidase domain-containing ABC transporter [Alphaproteobacteria bacterium]
MVDVELAKLDAERPQPRAWLKAILAPLRGAFREVILISLFVNLLALAVPIFVQQVYNRVIFFHGTTTLAALLIGVAIAVAFDFALRQARARMLQRVALRIDIELGRRLYDKIAALPLGTVEARPAGFWQALYKDAELVRNVFSGPTAVLVMDLPFAVIFVALIWVIAPPVVYVLLAALPVYLGLALLSGTSLGRATRAERRAGIGRDAFITELLAGRTTIKALSLAGAFRDRFENRHADTIEHALVRGGRGDTYGNLGLALSLLVTVSIVSVGALAIIEQQMTIGALIAATMLAARVTAPLNQLVNTWRTYASYRQAVRRLSSAFALAEERTGSAVKLARPQGRVIIENLRFGYDPKRPPLLDGISLDIQPGGMLGIVGRNGCGKTTLLKLIQGLYPPGAGRVLLDGADIAQFSRAELAAWIGYVPQECVLFAGTIRDNIALTKPNASDEEIVRAATLAGVHPFVIDLPDGYGTEIGEAGSRLSGGQRQRIAIARALLNDPPVLLLDEVTGNLDMQAEVSLRDALAELARERSVVVVTHTPILLRACANIIAMERGRIVLGGPAKDVLPRIFGGPPRPAPAEEAS